MYFWPLKKLTVSGPSAPKMKLLTPETENSAKKTYKVKILEKRIQTKIKG